MRDRTARINALHPGAAAAGVRAATDPASAPASPAASEPRRHSEEVTRMYARLELVESRTWRVVDAAGSLLLTVSGPAELVGGPALASLVADHGYPRGTWVPDGDGFVFEAL